MLCEICGREFKNASGLSGHKQLAHRAEPNSGPLAQRTQEPLLERVEERLTPMVERIDDGLRAIIEHIDDGLGTVIERICELADPSHAPGLCQDDACTVCQDSRADLIREAELRVHGRLKEAAVALGLEDEVDRMADVYNNLVVGKDPLDGITDPNAMYVNIEGLGLLRVVDDSPPTQHYEFYHNKSGNLSWGIPQ